MTVTVDSTENAFAAAAAVLWIRGTLFILRNVNSTSNNTKSNRTMSIDRGCYYRIITDIMPAVSAGYPHTGLASDMG